MVTVYKFSVLLCCSFLGSLKEQGLSLSASIGVSGLPAASALCPCSIWGKRKTQRIHHHVVPQIPGVPPRTKAPSLHFQSLLLFVSHTVS